MNLTGTLLVAMPAMGDPRFDRSVILLCAHSGDGAMGLIVNKPAPQMVLGDLLDQLDISCATKLRQKKVHFGGPVEVQRGFVLHGADYRSRLQSLDVTDAFAMTATLDVLEDMAIGQGPEPALAMLGYAGWGPGQLEAEIARNDWLTAESDPALVFDTDDDEKWLAAVRSVGIDPLGLSGEAGRA
ncbi:YqgE/AlgH family protein [uncultured Tateyamaria sp.]|uniref:YqgE/AlgH family protein n=1 Tax=Tateyamaria sp. 1078 TaxID=3417464 RepID=UPI002619B5FC|nr:YqgE/AlgH family protein [uncultured Tateyamaria sp.]